MTGLTARGWLVVAAGMVVVLLGTAFVAGGGLSPAAPPAGTGSVRLGPDPGRDVAGYLASLPAQLPPPGRAAPALVQLARPLDAGAAAALVPAGAEVHTAVLRVPIERVQTALRFEPVTGTGDLEAAIGVARERAAFAAAAELERAGRSVAGAGGRVGDTTARAAPERRVAVLAAERRALRDPACACVIALVVTAERAGLEALAARDAVRAVHAAPPGTAVGDLALSPLLPQQTTAATPPPDDGPVP